MPKSAHPFICFKEANSLAGDATVSLVHKTAARANYSTAPRARNDRELVHRVFEGWAAKTPDAVAVRFEDASLTYAELNRQANRVARALIGAGLEPESPVCICLEPGPPLAAAVLGVLKAGCAYVPISSAYPPQRIEYILNDSRADVLLTQSSLLHKVGHTSADVITLEHILASSSDRDREDSHHAIEPEQTAYILYTSGSSGNPKGVMVPHSSLAYYVGWHRFHLREEMGRVDLPLSSSICFAAAVTQFYTPLMLGRTLHILLEDTVRRPETLFAWYAEHRGFGLYCVPTLWNGLVTFAEKSKASGEPIEGPRCVLLSGEAVNESLIERSFKLWPDLRIWNLYGPTEATANGSAGELHAGRPVTLGTPLVGTRIHLVDEAMREVAPGETGELCIRGEGVATGYLNLPELTRERFLTDPFDAGSGQRLFRTGDLAKYDEEGALVFVGRKDFQVKVRGYRIECGEVEKALLEHDAVRQVVVVCCDSPALDKQLVAYLTFDVTRYASADELRAFLALRLPDYMIPASFVVLESFPQLANGKIDRSRLPPPGNARPSLAYPFVRPASLREKQIVRIWEEVLGLEGVGTQDNFFDLGGNSLKIAAAISRLRELLQADVSFRHFFDYPTPSALASVLKGATQDGGQTNGPVERLPRRPTYTSAVNQQSLWLLSQTVQDLSAYNMQFSLRLEGALDFDSLRHSIAEIIRRHESLRTVFKVENDRPVLEILDFTEPSIEVVDLRELEDVLRETEAARLASEECDRPFRLASGPLYRFKLFRLDDERQRLYVTVHHIIFDGRSIGVFAREFVKHYRAHRAGKPLPTATTAVQYQDYVAWQEQQFSGEARDRLSRFWKENLEGGPLVLDFPTDYTRPSLQTYKGAYLKARLDAELKETLADFNRREQSTPFMTLLAVFYALLYRYSNQEDILVGCPVANRNHPDLEGLIGYFANINVMRARLARSQSFRELLAAVRDNCLRAFEHGSLPFAKLVELMRPGKSLSHTPIFQVTFAYHDKLFRGQIDEQLLLDTYEDGNRAAKFDLAFDVQESRDGLELRLTYNTDLFAEETIGRFLSQYTRLLAGALADPEKHVARYELVSKAELQRTLVDWNSTGFDNERGRCLHHLFEQQAEQSPNSTALIFDGQQLTYDALNRRANQLARHLLARGVRKGSIVGVHMKRSADMIVALLGILKAGGAYLPLDPYYPHERIAYVIEDSGVPLIVTERGLEAQLPAGRAILISPDAEWTEIDKHASENLSDGDDADPHALMYLMYTSGSTGNPKGVMLSHAGPSNYVLWMRHQFPLTADDKVLAKTSINFDISVWEIFLPLVAGAQLVVGRDEDLQAPDSLAALIRREQITNVQFVPSALKAFVDSGLLPACDSLSRIFSGGEALSVRLREEVFESFTGELHNLYGPTEASIYVSHYACRPDDPLRSVSIGRPIHNAKMYILDEQLNPAPVGMNGELYLGGKVLADGYFKRPDTTAAKFLPDPFSCQPGARMFKTGDVARFLSDGRIEFLGRADRQVKVRGYRIELGEIEHSLARHPRVQHAIVIVREDRTDDVRLVAYLLYRDKKGPVEAELRDYLKQKLPDYMIPSTFVELDSIPLLPNNKVNMKALPRPEFRKNIGEGLERNYGSECERTLAHIWEEVLETEKFGPDDNFFDVGGHSLLIVRLRSLIEQRLGVEVSNIDLFQYVTIRSLARHLSSREQPARGVAFEMARRAALRNRRLRPSTR